MNDSDKKITACVFDFGGVMTARTMPEKVKPVAERLGIGWGAVTDGYAKYRRQLDGNFISFGEMYDLILADNDIEVTPDDLTEMIKADIESFCARNEETLAFMRSLKDRGYKIGILTNMPTDFVASFRENFGDYIALADALVISGEERMFKPQRRIYRLMAARLGVDPAEICFFDDVEANCEAARSCGWRAVRFADTAQAMRDFGIQAGIGPGIPLSDHAVLRRGMKPPVRGTADAGNDFSFESESR